MSFLRPGEHPDELISAAISGDISEREQAQLDAHLETCESCRQTITAWTEQRRLVSHLHHAPIPRDLGPRIRAGIESGAFIVPWWRRTGVLVGSVAGLATVAAALVAVAVISGLLPRNQVASTGSPSATASVVASPFATASSSASAPEATPAPTKSPPPIDPNPVGFLRYSLKNQQPKLEVSKQDGTKELPVRAFGSPIAASLSPDGNWIAFSLEIDGRGGVDSYAYRFSDGLLVDLATDGLTSDFSRMTWSADSGMLAYTVGRNDPDQASKWDVWILYSRPAEPFTTQLTSTGSAFVADFHASSNGRDLLWVSTAGTDPTTYSIPLRSDQPITKPLNLARAAVDTSSGAFLPLSRPTGEPAAIVWHGQMLKEGADWYFARGGMIYLAVGDLDSGFKDLGDAEQQIFDTLAIAPGGEALSRAKFAWAPDGDGVAVWDAFWTGTPQADGFPDEGRVYFGHPMSGTFIGPGQALDAPDTQGIGVKDVALGGGQYLAITVSTAPGSEGGTFGPTAELRLVTRHTGQQADEVRQLGSPDTWSGPAFYPPSIPLN